MLFHICHHQNTHTNQLAHVRRSLFYTAKIHSRKRTPSCGKNMNQHKKCRKHENYISITLTESLTQPDSGIKSHTERTEISAACLWPQPPKPLPRKTRNSQAATIQHSQHLGRHVLMSLSLRSRWQAVNTRSALALLVKTKTPSSDANTRNGFCTCRQTTFLHLLAMFTGWRQRVAQHHQPGRAVKNLTVPTLRYKTYTMIMRHKTRFS